MNPVAMGVLLLAGLAGFGWSVARRLRSLRVGSEALAAGMHRVPWRQRLGLLVEQALLQRRLRREPLAGYAHLAISTGFVVLLARTLVLWGRGFDPAFNLWVLGPTPLFGWLPAGQLYGWLKDMALLVVLGGLGVFAYLRLVRREARLTLNREGLVLIALIALMMVADAVYDGAVLALAARPGEAAVSGPWLAHLGESPPPLEFRLFPDPVGSGVASGLAALVPAWLRTLAAVGYWTHATTVLVLLNLLPYGKHFHLVTGVPNLLFAPSPGRLEPLATSSAALDALVDAALELPDANAAPIGIARIEHLTPKARLDLYACTECGRCTARCPAALSGAPLSPQHLILGLREELRRAMTGGSRSPASRDLVPDVVSPDVIWACTTCRACEVECPLTIGVIDKVVGLRRHLLTVRGEGFPTELGRALASLELHGNPFGRPPTERLDWARGLGLRTCAQHPTAEVLFWVGCAAAFDPRARRIARATASLLTAAGVDFAVLGGEERCTGDLARRAGHEALFLQLAEQNLALFARYAARGGLRRIVTGCPHCYRSLRHEYSDLGAAYDVVHSVELLGELVAAGRLVPRRPLSQRVVVHDACYLARYGDPMIDPRALLGRVPGLQLVEVAEAHGDRTLCCGGGGARAFLDDSGSARLQQRRAGQLADTGASVVATSCPYCMTMLTDGLGACGGADAVEVADLAELLAEACAVGPSFRSRPAVDAAGSVGCPTGSPAGSQGDRS